MQLTKEQIEELAKYGPNACSHDEFNELIRMGRAYLAEVEHHELEALKHEAKVAAWKAKRNRTLAEHFEQNANYHRARLAALQKGEE